MQSFALGMAYYLIRYREMGAVGAALSSATAAALGQPLLYWPLGRRLAQVTLGHWIRKSVVPGVSPAAMGALIWLGLKYGWPATTWLELGTSVSVGLVGYAAVLALCLSGQERKELRRVWQKVMRTLRLARPSQRD